MAEGEQRAKRSLFRRGEKPVTAESLPAAPPAKPRRTTGEMFTAQASEFDDPWSSDAWAEDGWNDEWDDPSRRARVRPAASPRSAAVDAWLESDQSEFDDVTADIAKKWTPDAAAASRKGATWDEPAFESDAAEVQPAKDRTASEPQGFDPSVFDTEDLDTEVFDPSVFDTEDLDTKDLDTDVFDTKHLDLTSPQTPDVATAVFDAPVFEAPVSFHPLSVQNETTEPTQRSRATGQIPPQSPRQRGFSLGSKLRLGGRTDDVVAIAAESAVETPNDSTTEVPPPFESVLALQRRTLAADPIVENVVLTPVTASSGAGSETDGLNVAAPDADPFSTLDTPTRALPTEPIGTRSSPAEPVSVEAIASEPIAPQPATKTRPISALEAAAAAAGRWPESVPRPASETSARTNPLRFETPPPRTERPGLSIFQLPAAPPPPAGNSWDLDDEAADSFEDQNLDTSETTRDEDFRDFAVTHQPKDGVPPPTPVFQDDFQSDFQNDFDDDFDTAADSSDRPKSVELDNSIAEWPIVAEETLDHDFASIPLTGIRHDDDFDDLDTSIDADLFAELDEEAPPYVRARTAAATSVAVTAPLLATLRTHPADPALTSPRVTEFDELWDDADTGSIAASSLDALLDDDTTVAPPPPATSLLPPPATSKARTAPVLAKPVRHTDTAKSSELPMTRLFLGSGLALAALSALRVVLALLSTLTASTDQSNRGDRFVDAAKVLGPVHGLLLVVATALILLGHYVGRDRLESVANLTGRGCGVIIATSAVTVMMAVATLVSDISDNGAWGASLQAVVDFAVLGGAAAVAAGMAWSATNDVT